jgi:hypothetical protein
MNTPLEPKAVLFAPVTDRCSVSPDGTQLVIHRDLQRLSGWRNIDHWARSRMAASVYTLKMPTTVTAQAPAKTTIQAPMNLPP